MNFLVRLASVAIITCAIFTLLGMGGSYYVWLDLFSHFRLQYFLLSIGCLIIFLAALHYRQITVAFITAVVNFFFLLPYYGAETAGGAPPDIRLMLLNVKSENRQYEQVLGELERLQPDVFVVQELNRFWVRQLAEVGPEYPYQLLREQQGHFGIGIYSRYPLSDKQIIDFVDRSWPSVLATVQMPMGQEVLLLATHPVPPLSQPMFQSRNRQLYEVGDYVARQQKPAVVLGDFNCSQFSPVFAQTFGDLPLRDTQLDTGLQPSWPVWGPLFMVTLDHVLVSPHWQTVARFTGNDIGSDHLPVFISLRLATAR